MESSFSVKTLIISIITGIVVVILFSWSSGSRFDDALYPVLALLSGFVVTGFVVGIVSKGITIIEPGIGSIVVAIVAYLSISGMKIKGFAEITQSSDWVILMMNGVILTFLGAWLGEKFQSDKSMSEVKKSIFDVSWIMAGTVFGVVLCVIVGIIVNFIFGNEPIYFIIPFFIALFVSGLLSGLKSTGITIKEAGISGFLIMTFIFSIVRQTLVSEIEIEYIAGGIILGFFTSFIGGWCGEKLQQNKTK